MSIKTALSYLREAIESFAWRKDNEIQAKDNEIQALRTCCDGLQYVVESSGNVDALGTWHYGGDNESGQDIVSINGGYWRLPAEYDFSYSGLILPARILFNNYRGDVRSVAIDCSQAKGTFSFHSYATVDYHIPSGSNVVRFLFPEEARVGFNTFYDASRLVGGLYLPRRFRGVASRWIDYRSEVEIPVKSRPGMEGDFFYLQNINISVDDMVQMLENLKEGNYTLTLGSANLNKLTEAQKEIAYKKGWQLK